MARRPAHAAGARASPRRAGQHRAARAALVAPRLAQVPPAMRPVLERRARTMLTQAHLSRHVIFHVFHTPAIPHNARVIFGVSPARFRTLRNRAMTPLAIGARGGRSAAHVRGALWTLLVARADRGVRIGAMSRGEARTCSPSRRRSCASTWAARSGRRSSRWRSSAGCFEGGVVCVVGAQRERWSGARSVVCWQRGSERGRRLGALARRPPRSGIDLLGWSIEATLAVAQSRPPQQLARFAVYARPSMA